MLLSGYWWIRGKGPGVLMVTRRRKGKVFNIIIQGLARGFTGDGPRMKVKVMRMMMMMRSF